MMKNRSKLMSFGPKAKKRINRKKMHHPDGKKMGRKRY